MSNAILVNKLSKQYRINKNGGYLTLRDKLTSFLSMKFAQKTEKVQVLKDVSFEVNKGEIVGIIGRNGAGKSTLLKILSRICSPDSGSAKIFGRSSAILEVGTGFNPELTGRENIYLNGAILGMSKKEISKVFDKIVSFSEIGKFLDTPVKRYSSGMYVRLAFAVAVHLSSEILFIDEVLAVGDVQFQKKCLKRIRELSEGGKTILFVSHNMEAVRNLCEKVMVIKNGRIDFFGETGQAIAKFLKTEQKGDFLSQRSFTGPLTSSIVFTSLTINGKDGSKFVSVNPSQKLKFRVAGVAKDEVTEMKITFSIYKDSIRVLTMFDLAEYKAIKKGKFACHYELPAYLLRPGLYSIALGGHREDKIDFIWGENLLNFEINEIWSERNQSFGSGLINIAQDNSGRQQ